MQVRLLGPLEVAGRDGAIPLGRAKERAVLTLLALHANEVVSEDSLADALWEDDPPRTASKTLQSYISRLRRALAGNAEMVAIESVPTGYRLRLAADAFDVFRVEELVAQARQAMQRDDPAWAAVALTEALRSWRGEPIAEFADQSWARADARRLGELRLEVLEERIDAELACGRHAALVPELDALCETNPWRERLWAQRIVALYRSGRQSDALRAYQQLRSLLAEELGIDPSPELQHLERAVLDHDAGLTWHPPTVPASTLPPHGIELPSGVVTFLLTDIERSTEMWEGDPPGMALVLARHDEVIGATVGAHGGRIIKSKGEGDSTMSVFTRVTDAVHAALAAREALAAQDWAPNLDVRVRFALHTGEAEVRDGDYFGPTVNRAARLRGLARGDEIYCSRPTADLIADRLPPDVVLVDLGPHELKGFRRLEHVYSIVGADEINTRGLTDENVAIPLPPSLAHVDAEVSVGRGQELAFLSDAFAATRRGEFRVVLVAGEPGIGKTHLAMRGSATLHADGATVLYGRCDEDVGIAFQPIAEALQHHVRHAPIGVLRAHVRDHGGELGRIIPELRQRLQSVPTPMQGDPDGERLRLFEAVSGLLASAAERRPLVIILDDLHWAAKATLLLLRHIVRKARPPSVLIIGTYRDTEVRRTHALAEMLADLRSTSGVERLALAGLDVDAVTEMLEVFSGERGDEGHRSFAERLRGETGGNPFFVQEVCRHMLDTGAVEHDGARWVARDVMALPEGVRDVIGRRLSRLSDDTNTAMALGAVMGFEFEYAAVEQVANDIDLLGCLEEALHARVIMEVEGAPGRYRFSHSLIRQTIYEELSTTRRVKLHRAVGEAIEAVHGTDSDQQLMALASHFEKAAVDGQGAKAADYAYRAGTAAFARTAYDEAAVLADSGLASLDLIATPHQRDRLALLLLLARARSTLFDPAGAKAAAVSAAELASRLELAAELAEAAQIAALATSVGVGAKPDPDIVNTCTAAIDTLGEAHPGLRARVSAALAQHYAAFGDPARAASMADDALHVARAEDDTESLCLALRVLVRTEGLGSPLEAVTDELVAAARRGGFAAHEAEGLLWQAAARLSLGDANGYVTSLRGLEELAARTRSFSVAANAAAVESSHALLEGRLDDVEYAIDRILEFGAKEPSLVFNAMVTLLRLRFEQGRLEEIADLAAMMDDDTYPIPARSLALAIYHMGRGDLEETRQSYRRFVDQGLDVLEELDHWLFAGLPWLADLVVEMDDAETAARLRESAMPLQGLIVNIAGQYGLASADRCLGQLATTTGDYDEAREHFDAALRLEQPFDTLVARTQYWYARMLAKRREPGDLQHALSLIEASSNTASRLGMATLHAQAQALASAVSMDAASSSL